MADDWTQYVTPDIMQRHGEAIAQFKRHFEMIGERHRPTFISGHQRFNLHWDPGDDETDEELRGHSAWFGAMLCVALRNMVREHLPVMATDPPAGGEVEHPQQGAESLSSMTSLGSVTLAPFWEWRYYPIVMPVTKDGMGPAGLAEADRLTWEVWERDTLRSMGSHESLGAAIQQAMELNFGTKS